MTKEIGWPAASTLIAAILGAVVTFTAMTVSPATSADAPRSVPADSNRELGELAARLTALEQSHQQLRTELREDFKELRSLIERGQWSEVSGRGEIP